MKENAAEVIVVGAGIVGLATAYQLLKIYPGIDVLVLEKEPEPGKHQTGNNSGVLHAGLYYQPGSLKSKLCVDGLQKMMSFCRENDLDFESCGKIVVATRADEIPRLEALFERGKQNGLEGLKLLGPEEIKEREPHAAGLKALLVPQEGIVDYRRVIKKIAGLIQKLGGRIIYHSQVKRMSRDHGVWKIQCGEETFTSKYFINCGGLHSDRVARLAGAKTDIQIVPFRGEYFVLKKEREHLVRHLIYPVPDPRFPFLGVHFTRMKRGGIECGPNAVLSLAREGYVRSSFNFKDTLEMARFTGLWKFCATHWKYGFGEMSRSWSKTLFTKGLQKLVPSIQESDLAPGGAGVRAQAMTSKGQLVQDFAFGPVEGGLNVLNTPSPAATASLAIGEYLVNEASRQFDL